MKSLREWVEENNLSEIFGLFGKPKPQEQAPAVEQPKQQRAFCPFCISWSGVVDDAYNGRMVWHCTKCKRDWDKAAVDRAHSDEIRSGDYDLHPGAGAPGPFLPKTNFSGGPDQGAGATSSSLNVRSSATSWESLYLAGLIDGEMYYENEQPMQQAQQNPSQTQQATPQQSEIDQIASQLKFQPTSKKKLIYQYVESTENMPAISYAVAQKQMTVDTHTDNTTNTAEPNDIIMSGPAQETYVIKAAKLPKLYVGQIGGPIHPEQSPRNVAIYKGKPVRFKASWGEDMDLNPGDYLVKEAEGKYYRIRRAEADVTYNPPGKIG